MSVRRFFSVLAPKGRRVHRVYNTTKNVIEGDKTMCNMIVSKEWKTITRSDWSSTPRCRRCERGHAPA